MTHRTTQRILTLSALVLISVNIAPAQSSTSTQALTIPLGNIAASNSWQAAKQVGSSKGELFVVTVDKPQRRQTCRVQSFTAEKLVCSRTIGEPRTYFPHQVVALLLPGDARLKLQLMLGLNGAAGVAIWGTVVVAAICPACAVATGVAALLLVCAAGAILIGDDQPDHLLYLAPGQQLSRKLGYVQYREP